MEFVIGGLAAVSAGILTNPLEVMKHHMELDKKSPVNRKYRNFIHAGYLVTRSNGVKSLQNGLSPAILAHLTSYGMKLGTYQFSQRRGYTTNSSGEVNVPMSMASSTAGGLIGQYMSSPFYLVKTHMELDKQEKKSDKNSYSQIAARIYRDQGLRGFFKGATASLPRAFIGTSQLTSFAIARENFNKLDTFKELPMLTTLLASSIAGIVLSLAMTPFDAVLTKLYKQAINPKQNSQQVYDGFLDCLRKTYKKEGLRPFYRGLGPLSMKLGPHTVLCLVFWEQLKDFYDNNCEIHDKYSPNLSLYNEHFVEKVVHPNSCELYW
ncbi:solute carrier family 25 member 35-like [Coccinella septempunctata]|uniref:solute carrier family 25 member 35-like n=1 Tax=Coccinella septempunctata TaxID=41139 RepID=UPI001D09083A|nr:solute carrier family 25 member 35-like [Coccinella septempunctata]